MERTLPSSRTDEDSGGYSSMAAIAEVAVAGSSTAPPIRPNVDVAHCEEIGTQGEDESEVYEGEVFEKSDDSSNHQKRILLPPDYELTEFDVVCGRGRGSYEHPGNRRFRSIVASMSDRYANMGNEKGGKSAIVTNVFDEIHKRKLDSTLNQKGNEQSNDTNEVRGAFLRRDTERNRWYVVAENVAREKISAAFRDILHLKYSSSNPSKKRRREERLQSHKQALQGTTDATTIVHNSDSQKRQRLDDQSPAALKVGENEEESDKQMENDEEEDSPPPPSLLQLGNCKPSKSDVLIDNTGRILDHNEHPGNYQFYSMVQSSLAVFNSAQNETERLNMVQRIVDQLFADGRHFLKQDSSTGRWYPVDQLLALSTSMQYFMESKDIEQQKLLLLALERKADQGDSEAQYQLALCYKSGTLPAGTNNGRRSSCASIVGCSITRAADLFEKAAQRSHAQAQYEIAQCYHDGRGRTQNLVAAVHWYCKAAAQFYFTTKREEVLDMTRDFDLGDYVQQFPHLTHTAAQSSSGIGRLSQQQVTWDLSLDGATTTTGPALVLPSFPTTLTTAHLHSYQPVASIPNNPPTNLPPSLVDLMGANNILLPRQRQLQVQPKPPSTFGLL